MTRDEIKVVLKKRDGDRCWWCKLPFGSRGAMLRTLDHVVPVSRGGTSELENLVLAHQFCNSVRGDDDFAKAREVAIARPKRFRGGWATPAAKALRAILLEGREA